MPAPDRVLSISQLNRLARETLEGALPLMWVEGELSNLTLPASGHLYFKLKDSAAQVDAAMFRNRSRLLGFRPKEGMHVRARGRVSLYEPRGNYQLIVEQLEEAGLGALQRAFDELKRRLAAEGLFDAARKRELPAFPHAVGVVTSASGAAIHDILTVLRRRAPWIDVVLYPTSVQGAAAAGEIVAALETANRRADVDVLIVGRGGGSLEDLWPFNEERVARAIVASRIPVISAVGHEVDVTISDFVADERAPTPSAAAERVAPPVDEIRSGINGAMRALSRRMQAQLAGSRAAVAVARKGLVRPDHRLREYGQRFDELDLRLRRAARAGLAGEANALASLRLRLRQASPGRGLAARGDILTTTIFRLVRAARRRAENRNLRLASLSARLQAISPLGTLARGYAIARAADGSVVARVESVRPGDALSLQVSDGTIDCRVEGGQGQATAGQ